MRPTMLFAALLLAPGCSMFSHQWEGVWFFEVPAIEQDECLPTLSENYDADPPDEVDVDSPWTVIDEATLSNAAYFVEVLAGKGNQVFAVFDGAVYPGTADKGLLQVSWTGSTDATYSEEHEDGYQFTYDELGESTTTITLSRGDKGTATGTLAVDTVASIEYAETDEWDRQDVGVSVSQIPSTLFLVGNDSDNTPNQPNCNDDDCELTIDLACSGEAQFAATFAGQYENGMFTGIQDASQSPGGPGIYIGLPDPYTYYGY